MIIITIIMITSIIIMIIIINDSHLATGRSLLTSRSNQITTIMLDTVPDISEQICMGS